MSGSPMGSGIAVEGNVWVVLRRPRPDLNGQPAKTLLALTAELPGSFRYARVDRSPRGAAMLLGEMPCAEEGAPIEAWDLDRWLGQLEAGRSRQPPEGWEASKDAP